MEHLSYDQEKVCKAVGVPGRCRVLVSSANETGKSFIAAALASWHYDCFRPGWTILTAPSQTQVHDIVFRELRVLRKGNGGFSPRADRLQDSDDHLCVGYTAKDATSFHGRHGLQVLGIFDEAEGIAAEFFEAGESFIDKWICFYNPTSAESQTAVEERSGKWQLITMSALNHPNVVTGTPIIPAAVTREKVVERLKKWAVVLPDNEPRNDRDVEVDGVWYRPGPVAEARVLGRRPNQPVNAVFASDQIERMQKRQELNRGWNVQIGCDVARFGDDFTVIHVRQGKCSLAHESHNGWDTKQIAKRLQEVADEYAEVGTEVPVVVDVVGMGAGVVDQRGSYNFIGVNTSSRANLPDDYPNIRSEIAFDFEQLLRHGMVDTSRLTREANHDISEQLRAYSYTIGPRGHRIVTPKKDLKKALGRSPDDADAILLAYYHFPPSVEAHARKTQ